MIGKWFVHRLRYVLILEKKKTIGTRGFKKVIDKTNIKNLHCIECNGVFRFNFFYMELYLCHICDSSIAPEIRIAAQTLKKMASL